MFNRFIIFVLLFIPACTNIDEEASTIEEEILAPQEISFTNKTGQSIKLYVFKPREANRSGSAIITVHGGGWKWGKAEWTFSAAERFAKAGLLAVALEYRLSNDEITPIDAFHDTCDTLKWVRDNAKQYKVETNKVAAYGVSAGGQLSSLAASIGCDNTMGSKQNGGPDLLLLWSPALDMEKDGWFKKLLQGKASVKANSPLATVNNNMPPVSIVQGELDTLTPLKGAQSFCEKIQMNNGVCEVNTYTGVGHLLTRNLDNQESNFDPDPDSVQEGSDALMKFLSRHAYTE